MVMVRGCEARDEESFTYNMCLLMKEEIVVPNKRGLREGGKERGRSAAPQMWWGLSSWAASCASLLRQLPYFSCGARPL